MDTPDDNDINNNHAALAESFQPRTLHKVRRLDRYTNTDTPDTAEQLDEEVVPAEVTYTRSNTQPSCELFGRGRIGPCPSRKPWQVDAIIHCDADRRSDHLQSGTTGADRTVHDGGRARGGGSGNEG